MRAVECARSGGRLEAVGARRPRPLRAVGAAGNCLGLAPDREKGFETDRPRKGDRQADDRRPAVSVTESAGFTMLKNMPHRTKSEQDTVLQNRPGLSCRMLKSVSAGSYAT